MKIEAFLITPDVTKLTSRYVSKELQLEIVLQYGSKKILGDLFNKYDLEELKTCKLYKLLENKNANEEQIFKVLNILKYISDKTAKQIYKKWPKRFIETYEKNQELISDRFLGTFNFTSEEIEKIWEFKKTYYVISHKNVTTKILEECAEDLQTLSKEIFYVILSHKKSTNALKIKAFNNFIKQSIITHGTLLHVLSICHIPSEILKKAIRETTDITLIRPTLIRKIRNRLSQTNDKEWFNNYLSNYRITKKLLK